jgi:hypothetical protein
MTLAGAGYLYLGFHFQWAMAVGITVSLLHFWYDGFIWSVRKREVG